MAFRRRVEVSRRASSARRIERKLAVGLTVGVAIAGVAGAAGTARAADPVVGIRSLAMGDTLRAYATGSEGLLLNPSGIAVTRQFTSSGFYSLRMPSTGHFLHASVTDSVTQKWLALGIYYTFTRETPRFSYRLAEGGDSQRSFLINDAPITRDGNEAGIVVAVPLGDRFSIGGTLKYAYYNLSSQLRDYDIPSDFQNKNPRIDKEWRYDLGSTGHVVTFDLGITVRIFDELRIGVVGQNLWAHGFELPTRLGLGASYRIGKFLVAGDAMIDFTGAENCVAMTEPACSETERRISYRLGLGAEYNIASKVPIRAGYLWDELLNAHHVSGGIGYKDPTRGFGLNFSLRQRVTAGNETVALFAISYAKE